MKSKSLLIVALSMSFLSPAQSLSLQDAINYAVKNHVNMKNVLLDQQSALAKNKEITGMALPTVKASAAINYAPLVAAFEVPNFIKTAIVGDPSQNTKGLVESQYLNANTVANTPDILPLAFQPKWTTTPLVEASQILFDPGITIALKARKSLEQLAQKNVALTREQLIVAVKKAYYNVLIAEKRQSLIHNNLAKIELLEKETREIYKNGLAEKIDVDRVTVSLNNLKTEEIRIKQLIDLTYMALKFQIGMPLANDIVLTDTLSEEGIAGDIINTSFDYNNRKEFQLQSLQVELSQYDYQRYHLAWMPSLNLFGNYGYTLYNANKLFDPADKWQKSALIGVKLMVPIFDGFQRKQKAKEAFYTLEKNKNTLENLKDALELEKENARITLQSNLRSLENQKSNLQLAEEVYNTAQIKYKEGVGSSIEVITAETSYKEAETNYFSSLYDVITSGIDLQKALGLIK